MRGVGNLFLIFLGVLSLVTPPAFSHSPSGCAETSDKLTGGFHQSIAQALADPQKLKASGDLIHTVWQNSNSYASRYKPMADENGKPITDIEKYIKDKNIPAEYRWYYLKGADGTYTEDIKKIPNQWLSYRNAKENTLGAQSILNHLAKMTQTPPKSHTEAVDKILEALQGVHLDWYNRVKEWNPAAPKDFKHASAEERYNALVQFYTLAKEHGLFKNKEWEAAFNKVREEFADQKYGIISEQLWEQGFQTVRTEFANAQYAQFAHLDPVEAFLALTKKAGFKPPIQFNQDAAAFFEKKLKGYTQSMPADRSQEPEAVARFLKEHFPNLENVSADNFLIEYPPVPPGSGARVYVIKDKRNNEKVAVLKIQSGAQGLDEVISSMVAEKRLPNHPDYSPVKTLGSGKLGTNDYFILQEAAKGTEVDKLYGKGPAMREQLVNKMSGLLSTMHGQVKEIPKEEIPNLTQDVSTLRSNLFYDVRQMNGYLLGGRNDLLKGSQQNGTTTAEQAARLNDYMKKMSEEYSKIIELKPTTLSPALVHGDFHGGNAFIDANGKVKVIDVSGATYFLGDKMATGDRGNDVGRMLGNIIVESTRHNLDLKKDIIPMMESLLSNYKKQTGIKAGSEIEKSFDVSVQFYMNRFLAVNAADVAGKKFKPLPGESQQALIARLYQNWQGAAIHMGGARNAGPQR